jgi:uncharacterized protein YbaP (TraB family)
MLPFSHIFRRVLAPLAALLAFTAQPALAEALRPALWKVSDADTTIYLFGTVHMLQPGADWLTGPVASALDGSDELVTEVVDAQGTAVQAAMRKRATLPAGRTLRAALPPAVRADYEALLRRIGLPENVFDRDKPWYAAIALASVPLVRRGFSPANGVEATLGARPAPHPRAHTALETADQQLALLNRLPRAVQVRYLASVVADYDRIDPEVDAMAGAWGKGDAEGLARLINEDEGKDDPMLTEALILRRNRTWAGWIRQRMRRPGTLFVAVGAGHLAGQGSVQQVLARSGLVVERVQ